MENDKESNSPPQIQEDKSRNKDADSFNAQKK